MHWNILASPYTKYNSAHHGNGYNKPETIAQTSDRYARAASAILTEKPDAVILQEVEPSFFDKQVNPNAAELLDNYSITTGFGPNDTPGTAVLLRQEGIFYPSALQLIYVGGLNETGGGSKSTLCVPVVMRGSRDDQPLWLCSIHMAPPKYKRTEAMHHLELTSASLEGQTRVILAGDWNAELSELEQMKIAGCAILNRLNNVSLPVGTATGLSGDFSQVEHIDHMFISSETVELLDDDPREGRSVQLEKHPISPWDADRNVIGASDHVWILVRMRIIE